MSITIVTLSAFSNLSGAALAPDIRHLLSSPVYTHLVLFSDIAGEQLAILPVGPGQEYTQLDDLQDKEIEGLRPLCALRTLVEAKNGNDNSSKPFRTDEEKAQLALRERELARKEESLRAREENLKEGEKRMVQASQNLTEREDALGQREAMFLEKEREFFRRGGEAVNNPGNPAVEPKSKEA